MVTGISDGGQASQSGAEARRDDLLAYIEAGRNRWTPQRKIAALTIIRSRYLGAEEVCQRFEISKGELDSWAIAFDAAGAQGLLVTKRIPVRRSKGRLSRSRLEPWGS